MWISDETHRKVFTAGRNDYCAAALEAERCSDFRPDEEDEWIADEVLSCYNCRYRRWTAQSFACMKT